MRPRERWIAEGIAVLRDEGIAGVRVDRIAARLGLTKGSFHHHFDGIQGYRRALLEHYESDALNVIRDGVGSVADLPAERGLMELADHVSFDPRLDAGIRGWAFSDSEARAVQERVDRARLDALVGLWRQIVDDPVRARIAALVPHLVMIGGAVAQPTLSEADLREVFALLAALVPQVR